MDLIRKSIASKLLTALLLLTAIALFADKLAGKYFAAYVGNYYMPIFFSVFSIAAFVLFLFIVERPFSKIFREMKALITGHQYKKIFTRRIDEVGVLANFFNNITKNMEKISVDVDEGKRMARDLEVASSIQLKILPTEFPQVEGLSLFGNTRAASEVGGDSFDVIQAGDNVFTYVGDVTGHGLPAALIMIMVNTLIRTLCETYPSGYDILTNTNRLLKQRIEQRKFMTCVLVRWNKKEQKLYYAGAGHEHILIYRKSAGVCEVKQTGGIALGMVPDISKIIKEEALPFENGDFIILYSDGIIEAKNMEGQMYGLDRLKKSVEQYAGTSTPEELFSRVSKDFGIFVGNQTQEDDITLIILKR